MKKEAKNIQTLIYSKSRFEFLRNSNLRATTVYVSHSLDVLSYEPIHVVENIASSLYHHQIMNSLLSLPLLIPLVQVLLVYILHRIIVFFFYSKVFMLLCAFAVHILLSYIYIPI